MSALGVVARRAVVLSIPFFVFVMMVTAIALRGVPAPNGISIASFDEIFAMIFIFMSSAWVMGKLLTQHPSLVDDRIPMPPHWRNVILDVSSWFRRHQNAEPLIILGAFLAFVGLGLPLVSSLTALNLPVLAGAAVAIALLYALTFTIAFAETAYHSAIVPTAELDPNEIERIVDARGGETLTKRGVEFLRKETIRRLSPRVERIIKVLSTVSLTSLALAWILLHFPDFMLAMYVSIFAVLLMMSVMLIEALAPGTKTSLLTKLLAEKPDAGEA